MIHVSIKFLCLLFLLLFLNNFKVEAQGEYMVVEKTLSNKQVTYSSGDKIVYKLSDEHFYRSDHIIALNDSAIEFHYHQIPYREISHIDIRGKTFINIGFNSVGGKLQFAGIAIIAIDQFNQVVIRGEDASFNEEMWIIGGSIFLAGTIIKWMHPKKLKIGRKYRIIYMNLNNI